MNFLESIAIGNRPWTAAIGRDRENKTPRRGVGGGGGGRSGRIRVIDVVRRGRKMNGTKETKGGGARVSTSANESRVESEREKEREEESDGCGGRTGEEWTTLGARERTGRK